MEALTPEVVERIVVALEHIRALLGALCLGVSTLVFLAGVDLITKK